MTVIAELAIPSSEFILGEVLEVNPGIHLEVERVVPVGDDMMPYVWVSNIDFQEFEAAVRASEHVESLVALDRIKQKVLYRVVWADPVESLVQGFVESNATILEAHGNAVWFFRLRFENHSDLSTFHNYCVDHGIEYTVDRITTLSEERPMVVDFGLTEEQREALVDAVEEGYFDVPRRTSLEDIAERYDITPQAASERVRRGAHKVLARSLLEPSAADL